MDVVALRFGSEPPHIRQTRSRRSKMLEEAPEHGMGYVSTLTCPIISINGDEVLNVLLI